MLNRRISIAPMMNCTDRHYRQLARLLSKHTLLYTEMVTTRAVINGDRDYLLGYNQDEHPIALQLGGSDSAELALSAKIGEDFGYDEINLNVGCPSDRVQAGRFGACLMKEPGLVADGVLAMKNAVQVPVTVKTRIGVDEQDSYEELHQFISTVQAAGCETFIMHARKAWLKGLSPKQNRDIPPLQYGLVYQLKKDFPELEIIINGGIKSNEEVSTHLEHVDGVMLGREAYSNPYWLSCFDRCFYGVQESDPSASAILMRYLPYVSSQLSKGVRLRTITRHLVGMFQGIPKARQWRRYLSENGGACERGTAVIEEALAIVQP